MNEKVRTLGKYQIVGDLGKGGFGLVFKAYDPSLERFVALKILNPAMARDVEFVGRFTQEAKIAANLSHPNIVHIYEIGEVRPTTFIAMEYVEGKTLAQYIEEKGKIPAEETLAIIEQAASALDFAHNKGMLHRDVKPSNILIDAEGHVKLTDFGLAKATTQSSAFSKSSSVLGTLQYISPEMAESKPVDKRADIYALGIVLYEMLTGQPPFTGDSPISFIRAHADKLPPAPSQFNKQISQDVQDVILKALAKNPDERFQTAGELAQTFKRALKRPFRPAQEVTPKPTTAPAPPPKRKKISLVGVMLILLLVCGGGGGATWFILKDKIATKIANSPTATVSLPVETSVEETVQPTIVPVDDPTNKVTPTESAGPTATPTKTPKPPTPTRTPTLTPTPSPTQTPTPTSTPPIIGSSGNVLVDVPGIQSAHPYADNEDKSWTINNASGLNGARIHFSRIEIENGVDKIEIRDQNDTLIQEITESAPDGLWSDIVPGTSVRVMLKTDVSVVAWGFQVDLLEPVEYTTIGYSPHPYPNSSTEALYLVNNDANPAGTQVHFSRIELENGVDYLVIKDANDVPYQWITGSHPDGLTTKVVAGAAIQIQLVSDDSVQTWGYNVDSIQTAAPDAPDPELYRPNALAESSHPYEKNLSEVWTLTNPDVDAVSSKIHFSHIELTELRDVIEILDSNDVVIQTIKDYEVNLTDFWSDYVPGRIVKVRFTTDSDDSAWGLRVDAIVSSISNPGIAQSDHPHLNNLEQIWTLTNPDVDAVSSKIHFSHIELTELRDVIEILDSNDVVIQTIKDYEVNLTDFWSDYVPGRIVKIRFTTDSDDSAWGFRVDAIVSSISNPGIAQSDHPHLNNLERTWTLTNPDVDAVSSRIHFSHIELTELRDVIEILDSNDVVIQTIKDYEVNLTDFWSDYVPGRIVKVRFTTDSDDWAWGFRVDAIESKK